jgi:hypothetical protein
MRSYRYAGAKWKRGEMVEPPAIEVWHDIDGEPGRMGWLTHRAFTKRAERALGQHVPGGRSPY